MSTTTYTAKTFGRELIMLILGLIWLIPFLIMVFISLKPTEEIYKAPLSLPSYLAFDNYSQAWSAAHLGRALINSIVITGGSVFCLVVIGSFCAYVLGRRTGKISNLLFLLFALGIIVPFQLGIIPTYTALQQFGLVGSYLGMILLYTGLWMPMAVFLYTGFVRTMPIDYEEAAQVDGASRLRIFVKVVFPLLRPVTGTVAILTGIIIWNDFFLQLIFLSGTPNVPLPVAVYTFVGSVATKWNLVFAAVFVSLAPVMLFFIFAQKHMIKGFGGGIKS